MKRRIWSLLKWLSGLLVVAVLLAALAFVSANLWVLGRTHGRVERTLPACSGAPVAIVFGTSRWTRSGARNPYFDARMSASARLLRLGIVDHLLLSGDNHTRFYNEPVAMRGDLRERAVADIDMTLDYAGFSTFDTLTRARHVFGVEEAVLVTQAWHLPRALFIADAVGIDATGCAAPSGRSRGEWRLQVREWVARAALLGDLYLWGREPHFLGAPEPLQIAPPSWERWRLAEPPEPPSG